MKKIICVLASMLIIFSVCMVAASGSQGKIVKADTPWIAASLAKMDIDNGNYDAFNRLFSEGRQSCISEEKFSDMKKFTTPGADYKNYELVTFSNGKMLLIYLTPEKIDGEYKLQDIIEVPDNMKSLFSNNYTK